MSGLQSPVADPPSVPQRPKVGARDQLRIPIDSQPGTGSVCSQFSPGSQREHKKYPGVSHMESLPHFTDACVSTFGRVTSPPPWRPSTLGSLRPLSYQSCEASSQPILAPDLRLEPRVPPRNGTFASQFLHLTALGHLQGIRDNSCLRFCFWGTMT